MQLVIGYVRRGSSVRRTIAIVAAHSILRMVSPCLGGHRGRLKPFLRRGDFDTEQDEVYDAVPRARVLAPIGAPKLACIGPI